MNAAEHRLWWESQTSVPYGLCWCGCGERTKVARQSDALRGRLKAAPYKFLHGHRVGLKTTPLARRPDHGVSRRGGHCYCGCGQKTNVAPANNSALGYIKGEHYRYLRNHAPSGGIDLNRAYAVGDRGWRTPCWIWQHKVDEDGYGRLRRNGKYLRAHRFFYEQHIGPIPGGFVVDHLCRIRNCVNPDHLEPVTNTENVARGWAVKLSSERRREIRRIYKEHGVSRSQLCTILNVGEEFIQVLLP